jgi:hypothetical protein
VTLADGSLTSSLGSFGCNVMLKHERHRTLSFQNICFHILPNLAFDGIIGYPRIRKYSLIDRFPSLFSETCLQVHNCTKCRQCLPGFFQLECTPSDGETCSEVLLAVPCAGTLVNQQWVPCRCPGGPVVNELICDRRGVGQASAPTGPVSDRQTAGHASEMPWSTGPAECWLSDSVTQARNRLFAYLNGQRVGIGSEESKEEWRSNPNEETTCQI